jgi:hypothetical protein
MKIKLLITLIFAAVLLNTKSTRAQKLESEFLFKLNLSIGTPIEIGKIPIGQRVIYPITGGTFEGPKLKGEVQSFGADWILRLDSTTSKIDVRILLKTEEGETISCSYNGIIYTKPDGTMYWRTSPVLETSSSKYAYLNHLVMVGVGSFIEGGVSYEIFGVK